MSLTTPIAYFLDTSALVPRYLRGASGYIWVNEICAPDRGNVLGIAEITEVELVATLHQLTRGRVIRSKGRDIALASFWDQVRQNSYKVVSITSALIAQAITLCARHSLEGYDAVQLACWPPQALKASQ